MLRSFVPVLVLCSLGHISNAQDLSWTSRITEDIRREEYEFNSLAREPGVWAAPNRAHELRSRISVDGVEVGPRHADADAWKLTISTKSFGRGSATAELAAPTLFANGARIELDHGALVEWFVNDERGIEHGWTIDERPSGDGPLRIALDFGGDLSLRIDSSGRSGVLVDARGEATLRYSGLIVLDAAGCELEARIVPESDSVHILIDDSHAKYPLTVDPILTGPAWTVESNVVNERMGESVATAGDVNGDGFSDVIVGAPSVGTGGRAYVYLGSAAGLSLTAAWTAECGQAGAGFADCVATAGDVNGDGYGDVIVGAFTFDNGQSNEGRAFVYLGSASGLATAPAWTAESDNVDGWFARDATTAGDLNGDGYSDVIVGAQQFTNGETREGSAYVYLGSSSGLSTTPHWTAESDQIEAHYGESVAAAGDVNGDGYDDVLVGAELFDNGSSNEGRASLYLGSATGLSTSPAWTAEANVNSARLGSSVSGAGDVNADGFADVIVGAETFNNGQTGEGRAFVYLGSAGGLALSPAWTTESNQSNAFYAEEVAPAGDVNGDGYSDVLVGSFFFDNGETDEGRAFLYLGSSTGLASTPAWTAEGNQDTGYFARTLGVAGDVNGDGYSDVIVGHEHYDNVQSNEGRALVYTGSALGLSTSSAWTVEGDQASARLGTSVANAGDVNGDGYSDVIVGAPRFDGGEPSEGRSFVYTGSSTGLSTSAAWTAESDQNGAEFGAAVASAGDVNGDGYGDVVIGAPLFDAGQPDEGRSFVYLGSSTGLAGSAAWTAESDQSSAKFAAAVASAGDLNGDGFSDVIVGAPEHDNGQNNEGRAFVYLGSVAGLATTATWTAEGNQADAQFGCSLSSAGDVNADGRSDVVVGCFQHSNGELFEGRAFAYFGSPAGLSANASWTAESDQLFGQFGICVSTAGDVNGDGYSDVIVGADGFDNDQTNEGRAFVYLGSATGLASSAAWTAESDQFDSGFGHAVSSAGDVNGDGYSDVIVGAHLFDNVEIDEGRAYVYLGAATGPASSAQWLVESNQADSHFGWSVTDAGDVNGDGYGDVVVGAPRYANGQSFEGRAFAYLGNEGRGGWTVAARQRRSDDTAPIDLLGRSADRHEFSIRLGFERELAAFRWASPAMPTARLEWEVAPLRAPLDGGATLSSATQAITGAALVFDELASFVSPDPFQRATHVSHAVAGPAYHWRARVRTNNPVFPVTPWVSIPGNNVTEAKLRVGRLVAAPAAH